MKASRFVPAVLAVLLIGSGAAMADELTPTPEPVPAVTEPGEVTETPDGSESEGTESEGTESEGTESDGTESDGTESEGAEPEGTEAEGDETADGPQLPPCPEDVANHGEYVSSVARSEERRALSGAERGALVAAAAQSDCGKPADETAAEAESDEASDVESDEEADSDEAAPAPQKAEKSNKGKKGQKGKKNRG